MSKQLNFSLQELNRFLGLAAKSTYAAGTEFKVNPETGFKEIDLNLEDWSYKDSYCGYFRSWGRETVWHKRKLVWSQEYGGGMEAHLIDDAEFANKTFNFLKKALSKGEKELAFQPRGPESFKEDDWKYECRLEGNLSKFKGNEAIRFKGNLVFTHDFFGGLVIPKDRYK